MTARIYQKINFAYTLAAADFRKRYLGAYFGILWMVLQPLVNITIYYCVFMLGFKSAPVEGMGYVYWLIPGIVPWYFFSDAVTGGVSSLSAYRYIVKQYIQDSWSIPMGKVLASLWLHLMFLAIMCLALVPAGIKPTVYWLQIFYYLLCNLILIMGITFLTSALDVFI